MILVSTNWALKKLLILVAFSVLLLVPLGSQNAFAALVSNWEAEGDYTDSVDGNNGTPTNENAGSEFTTGKIGQGFDLDGNNDYVLIGDKANLEFGTGDFSVAAWVKTSFIGGTFGDFIISKISTGTDAQYSLQYRAGTDGTATFFVQRSSDGDIAIANSPCSIADGQFHHLVGVRQGTTAMLYLNGILVGTGNSINLITSDSSNAVVIGGRVGTTNDPYFNGIIDDVRIFDHALSAQEVQALAGISTGCPGSDFPVGGEFIGIDAAAVLVAGTHSVAAWMIPVIVSAIGIAIVIARKF